MNDLKTELRKFREAHPILFWLCLIGMGLSSAPFAFVAVFTVFLTEQV